MVLLLLVVLPGITAVLVCGYYLSRDWSALISAFARLERAAEAGDLRSVTVAQAYDTVYRINAFTDGVGVMLGAILAAIGIHGLCVPPDCVRQPGQPTLGRHPECRPQPHQRGTDQTPRTRC